MKLDVELISEMVIFDHRLVQVGSGAAQGLPCLVWRGGGFAGLGGLCVCLGVGGVPHQLYGGGRVRLRNL